MLTLAERQTDRHDLSKILVIDGLSVCVPECVSICVLLMFMQVFTVCAAVHIY